LTQYLTHDRSVPSYDSPNRLSFSCLSSPWFYSIASSLSLSAPNHIVVGFWVVLEERNKSVHCIPPVQPRVVFGRARALLWFNQLEVASWRAPNLNLTISRLSVTWHFPRAVVAIIVMASSVQSTQQQERLLKRLTQYERAGWLSRPEYNHFRDKLFEDSSSSALGDVARTVEEIVSQHFPPPPPPPPPRPPPPSQSSVPRHVSDEQRVRPPEQRVHWRDREETSGGTPPKILDPRDAPTNVSVKQLFVEVCFFARLGCVQPPCCLHCCYQEATADTSAVHLTCNRWVAWRRDANHVYHPDHLDGNVVLMPCHAVRNLLKGKAVDGHVWDASQHKLLRQGADQT
jgi:hypothetical protein